MILRCTKHTTYEARCVYQREHDYSDNTYPGWYAWVGPPGDQSDFVVGPCKTRAAAEESAMRSLERIGYTVRAIEKPKPPRTKAMRAKRKQEVPK